MLRKFFARFYKRIWFGGSVDSVRSTAGAPYSTLDQTEIHVEQVTSGDEEILEEWERQIPKQDFDYRGVGAQRTEGDEFNWSVWFSLGEFIREGPLDSVLSKAVWEALENVEGVKMAGREDREVFVVDGNPNGRDLVEAASRAIDKFLRENGTNF